MNKNVLWLDLEDTVIEPVLKGWGNVSIIPSKIEKIKKFMKEFKPDEVNIFSFAIHNDFEKRGFEHFVKPWLEEKLECKFTLIPTVDDEIKSACCAQLMLARNAVTFSDMVEFWGKQIAFKLFIRHHFHNQEVTLCDDAVHDEITFLPGNNTRIEIFNIDSYGQ